MGAKTSLKNRRKIAELDCFGSEGYHKSAVHFRLSTRQATMVKPRCNLWNTENDVTEESVILHRIVFNVADRYKTTQVPARYLDRVQMGRV